MRPDRPLPPGMPPDRPRGLDPPLKWAGGKRWLVPHLLPYWEACPGARLVEPFVGGLAVALGLAPRRALLNDVNAPAVNFYRWLRRGLVIEIPMENERELYYRHREELNRLLREGEGESRGAAERFYYLNRTCYNGLCRFNSRGEFNVPFGRHSKVTYRRDFRDYMPVLAPWELTCGDFEALAPAPDDFVYADPPYDVEFRSYSPDGFDWPEQERLARWLARHPGPVAASNQATPRIVELYGDLGFSLRFLEGPRSISRTGDRTPAQEILALRNLPEPPA